MAVLLSKKEQGFTRYVCDAVPVHSASNGDTAIDNTTGLEYTYLSSGWVNSTTAEMPQSQKVYVDSTYGVDTAGNGNLNSPYLTPEFALSDITNTATITGDTNTSVTITNISDADNATLEIGMYLVGTGIPYGTVIVSKGNEGLDANTVTISKAATSTTAGLSITWYQVYTLVLNGDFVATGNWYKNGFNFECGNSNIAFAGRLFERNSALVTDFSVNGGYFKGTSNLSALYYSASISGYTSIYFNLKDYYSIGTGYQIYLQGVSSYDTFSIECPKFDCRFGAIAYFRGGYTFWKGYKYGLTGGIELNIGNLYSWGQTETPSAINAFNFSSQSTVAQINDKVIGSTAIFNYTAGINFTGDMNGTTLTAKSGNGYSDSVFSGNVRYTNINVSGGSGGGSTGSAIFSGTLIGTVNNSAIIKIACFQGTYIGTGSGFGEVTPGRNNSRANGITAVDLSGSCILNILDSNNNDSFTSENCTQLNIGAGCTLNVTGKFFCNITADMAGTINVPASCYLGFGYSQWYNVGITGNFNILGGTVELWKKLATENSSTTPALKLKSGSTLFIDGGKLFCSVATSLSGLIWKQSDNSKVILKGQPYLKVANGLAPLQITSNVGTAQDVINFGVITNGAVGFRLADTFSDITYGTAYAPNILVGGATYEDTTYDF